MIGEPSEADLAKDNSAQGALLFSVIVPVYRDWERLAVCLDALEDQTLSADRFEVIIANNDPEGHCPLERLPKNVRSVHQPKPGSYAARNAAVATASGRHLAFTDSDCVPERDWLENGLAALEANPGARVTGAITVFRQPGSSRYAFVYDLHTAFPQRSYVASGVCVTANLIVPRSVFDRIGPFDERLSGGDILWNRRAHEAGTPIVYDDSVRVGHPARRNLGEIFKKRRRTAGSSPIDLPVYRFVLERMKPPARRFVRLVRKGVPLRDAAMVVAIHWLGRLVEAKEFALVRWGFKNPSRS